MQESSKMHFILQWILPIDITNVTVFILLLAITFRFFSAQKRNLPPGPINLPIVGHIPFMIGSKLEKYLSDLKKKYGDVIYLQLGAHDTLLLTSHETVKEALQLNSEVAVTRPESFSAINHLFDDKGHIVENGKIWLDQRRFLMRTLRDLGLGKQNLENQIQEEASAVVEVFRTHAGQPFNPEQTFINASASIIATLVFGHRYNYSDPEFQEIMKLFTEIPNQVSPFKLVNSFPYIRYFLPGFITGMAAVEDSKKKFHAYLDRKIHYISTSSGNSYEYTQVYLNKQKEDLENGNENSPYTHERLRGNLLILHPAGIATTASTMYWAMKMIIMHPKIQNKLQSEIDHVVGSERVPCYSDKPNMPYMECFIMEVHRFGSVVPIGVPHATKVGTKIAGYDIPPGTSILTSTFLVHSDKEIWGDPENFRPERFNDKDGKRIMTEYLFPFGTGRRSCPGENLASTEIFIYITWLLQNFVFSPASMEDANLEIGDMGFTRDPCPYKIIASPRSTKISAQQH